MVVSRRGLFVVAAGVPVALVTLCLGDALKAVGTVLRPAPSGTTATRCAACGARDHSMLDPDCPATPRVRPGARA